jgi:pilus assembly protein CpaE
MAKSIARIVIIDEDPMARSVLRSTLERFPFVEILAETDSLVYGYELVRNNRPELVFIDMRRDSQKTLETMTRISTYFKESMMVVSGHELSLENIMACMQAGAREFLTRPLQAYDVQRLLEKHQKALTADFERGDNSGRIVTVFSNKGGLGKTTIAVNLALALSEVVGAPVALVDLNLQLGDITTFLDITPKQTIIDISKNIGRVDASYLENSLATYEHGRGKLFILADPLYAEEAEEISAAQINTVLTVLKSVFPYVVVDTNTSFDSKTLTALDLADNILLTSIVNLPNIRSTQRVLTLFERLGYDDQKVKLIINRYVQDEEITLEDVEETLEHPIYHRIPNNYQLLMTAINRGVPIPAVERSERLWANFHELAHKVSGLMPKKKEADLVSAVAAPHVASGGLDAKGLLSQLLPFGKKRAGASSSAPPPEA